VAIETEIKYTVADREILTRIAELDEIDCYRAVDRGIKHHFDTYFDTPDFRLLREKVVFRLRRWGNEAVLTFKAQGGESDGELHRRHEIEENTNVTVHDIIQGRLPDLSPVRALYSHAGKVKLFPSLNVDNRRHIIDLTREEIVFFEIALDDVRFCGPGGIKDVIECEIEAVHGGIEDLKRVGVWLAGRFDLEPAGPSKYILGMELVGSI